MHRLIHQKDKTLPVEIHTVKVKVRNHRKQKVVLKPWPVIPLSNWMRECFEDPKYNGFFFLGGHNLGEWEAVQQMFTEFWDRYRKVDPSMVPEHPSQTVPIYLHGDEGRGLGKRPLLVISYQPVISWAGHHTVPSTKQLIWLWPSTFNFWCSIQYSWIKFPIRSYQPWKAHLHDSTGLHCGAFGMLCPARSYSGWPFGSSGEWPRQTRTWRAGGETPTL